MEVNKTENRSPRKINSFVLSFTILFIFGFPALIGGLIAREVDEYFGTFPIITIGIMVVLYIVSWIFVLKTINSFIKVK